jgi:2-keto-3-deoxy-6-phosphogluconate aldolase
MFKCGFIYVAPGVDPEKAHAFIPSDEIQMTVVGCANYDEAVKVAKDMVESGITAVELCAGFGFEGTAMIKQAIPGIPVGSVKFDFHPAFDFKTGDDVFK